MIEDGLIMVYWVADGASLALPVTVASGNSFGTVGYIIDENFINVFHAPGPNTTLGNPGFRTYRAVAVAPRALAMGDEYVQALIKTELEK